MSQGRQEKGEQLILSKLNNLEKRNQGKKELRCWGWGWEGLKSAGHIHSCCTQFTLV